MSSPSEPDRGSSKAAAAAQSTTSTGRILACALCKQRRVKCTRSFPCENCVRAGVECVQPVVQQRRRRFAERALLDRIQAYERLLRRNNIPFEPLHGHPSVATSVASDNQEDDFDPYYGPGSKENEARDVWLSIKRVALEDEDDDDLDSDAKSSSCEPPETTLTLALQAHDHLLFGAPNSNIHLPSMHPAQVHIFKLWQVYLDNINPLLKITHVPTLQPRIIDAASHVEDMCPRLEALMFSIYCVAVHSMTDEDCFASFHISRDQLLSCYQLGCKQALLRCTPWRSNDRDCLTALYLYLLSISQQVDPRSLACMVAVAIRIAQRMGMPYEPASSISGCKALEFEMRRRLWWSLVLLDNQLCEMLHQERSTSLCPAWDCRVPLNVNDFELRADMKKPPAKNEKAATETLFVVVRSELADFLRRSASHLAIIGGGKPPPEMVNLARREGGELKVLEKMIESKYLVHCDPENALHYMTLWCTRGFFARARLVDHYLTYSSAPPDQLTETQRSQGYEYAIRMLECDTKIRTSPLMQGYVWYVEAFQCPIVAILHILHGLAKRPGEEHADKAWNAVCQNYEALMKGPKHHRSQSIFALKFSAVVLQAWDARQTLRRQRSRGPPEDMPRLVVDSRVKASQLKAAAAATGLSDWSGTVSFVDQHAPDLFSNFNMNMGGGGGGGGSLSVVFPSTLLPGGPGTPNCSTPSSATSARSGGPGFGGGGVSTPSTMGAHMFNVPVPGHDMIDANMAEQFWSEDPFKFM
ncbi:hypothetical protein QBC37DRAFT_422608 [Rhypophila decipiens]|uniref:Zn(2)-C6 fungal-type domain-containing protein n=1 Tax=Rhypophila decipiens TaxID=261697 RepID=A0AAN6Y6P8_9PEZI|nr:hypothetical protein QBC37DRAFT_422608 [Rhypophila decipiens]